MVGYILFYLGIFFTAGGKSIADIVADVTHWGQSVFNNCDIEGFFGCKDHTWDRKKRKNIYLNYLFSTILVWTTDIWHFANMVSRLGIYISLLGVFLIGTIGLQSIILHMSIYVSVNILFFHLMYTYFLVRKDKK